jgi:hypothetical protein
MGRPTISGRYFVSTRNWSRIHETDWVVSILSGLINENVQMYAPIRYTSRWFNNSATVYKLCVPYVGHLWPSYHLTMKRPGDVRSAKSFLRSPRAPGYIHSPGHAYIVYLFSWPPKLLDWAMDAEIYICKCLLVRACYYEVTSGEKVYKPDGRMKYRAVASAEI